MYSVLIVDDEKMIRMGMRQAIRWTELGVGEVFTAGSGGEALEIIEKHHPEIVITDISMTGMTGLDLIQAIRENDQQTRLLVLTGYDKFEYARECLRMNVQDFLLKPIDEEVLSRSVKKQVQSLEKERRDKAENLHQMRTMGSSQQAQLESDMREIIRGKKSSEEIQRFLEVFGLEEMAKCELQVAILVPALFEDFGKWDDNFRLLQVKDICIGMLDARAMGLTFQDEEGKLVLVLVDREGESMALEQVMNLRNVLQDEFDAMPRAVMGSHVDSFAELQVSYNDAVHLLHHEREDLFEVLLPTGEQSRNKIFREIYGELKASMTANVADADYVLHVFQSFCRATISYNLSSAYVGKCCFELASSVYFSYIGDSGDNVDGRLSALLQSLVHADKEEACEMTEMFLRQLLVKEDNNHDIITKARIYIKEHLAEELSVTSLAEEFYLTPNYFSRLFKRVVGEGCNEYIAGKRMDKAKSLLETTSYKTGKIAIMVGYRDTNYFSMAFKKHTGVSPTKYRENIREK